MFRAKRLVRKLKEPGWTVQLQAAKELSKMGKSAVPALLRGLGPPLILRTEGTACAFRFIGPAAVPALSGALSAADEILRAGAAWALGIIRDEESVPALVAALGDGSGSVQYNVAEALGRIGGKEARAALVELLEKGNDAEKKLAANGLSHLAYARAVPVLIGMLKETHREYADTQRWDVTKIREDDVFTYDVSDALARIGARAVPRLITLLKDGRFGRRAVAALKKIGDEALPSVIRALKGKNATARRHAAMVLAKSRNPQSLSALKSAWRTEKDEDIRAIIRKAVAGSGGTTRRRTRRL